MIAVVAYNLDQFRCFDRMYESFRDICESGFTVDLFIYTVIDWPQDILESLESRIGCRHPLAQFNVSMVLKDQDVGHDLVRYHKALFYDNVDNYDLFIYTEDDHLVLLRHITAYLEETNRLKQILGTTRFTDYSIGFVRYEANPLENFSHTTFEHNWNFENFNEIHLVHVEGMNNATYFTPGSPFHQGMYMATSEQFQAWSERGLKCRFNDTTTVFPGLIREYTSSLWLYSNEGCNVTQLIPARSYHDFFIYHLSDKYVSQSKPWPNVAVSTIGSMLRNSTNSTKSDAAGQSNGLIKMIDERVSS
jgi:DNA-dependent RNA polymerase auxiliary subunit epsilon